MAAELEVDFHVGVALGEKLDGIHSLLSKKDPTPNYLQLARAGTGTSVALDFGKPPSNKIWNVLAVVAYGPDDHTAVAGGNMAWYTDDSGSLMALRDTGIPIAGSRTYSRDIMWCYPGQNLFVVMTATGSTQMGANIVVAEWSTADKW